MLRFKTVCRAMNIESLSFKFIKGLKNCSFKSSKDHSKWVIASNSLVPWTCVGDVNRAVSLSIMFSNNNNND